MADFQIESLDPQHAETIRATLPLVGSKIDDIAPSFYRRMFAAHPELLRDTFNRGNQAQGAQQRALAASVATFASLLVTPDSPSPDELLSRIGHKHVSVGITEDQYQIVHDHLFAAIVEILGADVVTPAVAAAWEEVYWIMARTLVRFEKQRYGELGVADGDVFRTVRVLERIDHSDLVASFLLGARDGESTLPTFEPGQYISVRRTMGDGARQLRQYSLCNTGEQGQWQITVKKILGSSTPDGEVSSSIIDGLHAGDELEVSLPTGDLVLTPGDDPVVLISAGIGATPMLGMARHLAMTGGRQLLTLHSDHDAADAPLVDELVEATRDAGGRHELWFSTSAAQGAHTGRMDLTGVELPERAQYHLCGGNAFLQNLREQLQARGVPSEDVHYELFSPNDWLLPG
ncbi:globin domain-containing protein [Luteococcus sp. Sow4_B9]|uniref:globin domain-containing protein n=1 Tax=Luteococcus sp. Sow4_B9 TaxID=3438792 RepID=UPI003F9AE09B